MYSGAVCNRNSSMDLGADVDDNVALCSRGSVRIGVSE